jgi:serine/threonine protein kinase
MDPFGLVGQVLDGQFRVDAHIGEGGFSVVYKGTHVGLDEPIAIKCLKVPPALGSALVDSFVKRFRDESRLHYKLSQGNLHVARSIASGTTTAPATNALVPYTVLEWLEGRSLAEELEERRARSLRGRPMREAVQLLDSAVDALAYAHAQGVVHRDVNPGNLFLASTPSGPKLKVLDFGVAKILADSAIAMSPSARTIGNVRMFAPAYGAPEQFDTSVGAIGPWTDVYALAIVLLEVVSDREVRQGEHLGEFAMKALDEANAPTPRTLGITVGDEVERVMALAVRQRPADRPGDAGEFWGMLKHALAVDAEGRSAADSGQRAITGRQRDPSPESESPSTLRLDEPVTRASLGAEPAASRSSAPPRTPSLRPLDATLRMNATLKMPGRPSLHRSIPPPSVPPPSGDPARLLAPPPPKSPAFVAAIVLLSLVVAAFAVLFALTDR